jgi:putative transposase
MEKIREKKHRLPDNFYRGYNIVAYTICTHNKEVLFTVKEHLLIEEIKEILKKTCTDYKVKNWIYVFMPDHVHLILQGSDESSDIRKMINMFKQRSGMMLKMRTAGRFRWQKNYYDHVLGKEDDLLTHVKYIAENPVRKKMIDKWENYRYTGSVSFDIEKIINNMQF